MTISKLENYLMLMVECGASDMFLSVGARPNLKIEGKTMATDDSPLDAEAMSEMVFSILDDEQRTTFEDELELNMALDLPDIGRFRVNIYRQRGNIAMVARHIKQIIPSIEELGLPQTLKSLIMEKRGLILIVGATGSGKTTTLASMLDHRNNNETCHILTIEDPVEFLHDHKMSVVDQREVGIDTLSYSQALKSALREAPDVIMIGEIRDAETMQHALHFAETGHLCLATLHASNTSQAIERIINFFPLEFQKRVMHDISLQLRAIVSQRLIESRSARRAVAVEILQNTANIADLIRSGNMSEIKQVMHKHAPEGSLTFDQSLYDLYKNKKITAEDAVAYADSKHDLRLRIDFGKQTPLSEIDTSPAKPAVAQQHRFVYPAGKKRSTSDGLAY